MMNPPTLLKPPRNFRPAELIIGKRSAPQAQGHQLDPRSSILDDKKGSRHRASSIQDRASSIM
ncbi:MAG: hypothetical protein AB1797_00640 [bacterium]